MPFYPEHVARVTFQHTKIYWDKNKKIPKSVCYMIRCSHISFIHLLPMINKQTQPSLSQWLPTPLIAIHKLSAANLQPSHINSIHFN